METSPRNCYPRALPFRSPDDIAAESERRQEELQDRLDDLAAQAGRLRRWTVALGLALVGALVLATTVTVLLLQHTTSPAVAQPTASLSPPLATLPAAPSPPKQSAPPPSPAVEPTTKDMTLEAMGGLSAANLYQSHLAIGLLADGVERKAFTVDGAAASLKTIGSCLALVDSKLAKLDKLNLEPDDVASVRQIKAVTALMRIQTEALRMYWATGKMEHGEAYHRARKATWTGLSKVLGLEAS